MVGSRWLVDGGRCRWSVVSGRWTVDGCLLLGGQASLYSGQRAMVSVNEQYNRR